MAKQLSGLVAEFLKREYNGVFAESVAVDSIGITPLQIFGNDPERGLILLVNLSVNTIYIGYDPQVSSLRGITLGANGGSYSVNIRNDFQIPSMAHYAIATGVTSNLFRVTTRRIAIPEQRVL
ncbi:hypothetical protein LCGC14_0949250 [marine sediment metagenome]|uniref:Uncharacterized protein n=1 Tax=marine sediment metagenome TaxID=412755 RepID=A0A0F9P3X4_9ZZZZ